jgi:hypothetical protein
MAALITLKDAKRFDSQAVPPGAKIAQGVASFARGTVSITGSDTTATVSIADFDGALVFLTPAGVTYSSVHWYGAVASGTLTVTVDTAPGGSDTITLNYLLVKA